MATSRRQPYRTAAERAEAGKLERKRVPRSSHGVYEPAPERPDPVATWSRKARPESPNCSRCATNA